MGSNMAENHPVGFQWVMEARERGAEVHPRRPALHAHERDGDEVTSASAPARDIAFLGGIVNYILENERWFDEYVKRYTNAPVIIDEEFADTEDLDGLFSGWDPEKGKYDIDDLAVRGHAGARRRRPARGRPGSHEGRAVATAATAAALEHGEPARGGPDAAAPALRLPDPEAPLRALHAGVRRRRVRLHASRSSSRSPSRSARTRAASAPARSSTRSAGRSTRSASS